MKLWTCILGLLGNPVQVNCGWGVLVAPREGWWVNCQRIWNMK
jgi:hypothetical protein